MAFTLDTQTRNIVYFIKIMKQTLHPDDGIRNLLQRLDMALNKPEARIITFISARAGEGTSTIARDYVRALADEVDHEILLIDAGRLDDSFYSENNATPETTLTETVAAGQPLTDALYPLAEHVKFGRWSREGGRSRNAVSKLLNDDAFWENLHNSFGTVVIDAPSLQASSDGIALAVHADATVLVVEAETTRQPVIEHLRDTLSSAGAQILGVVMNKRHFYIPAKVYQNM